MANFNQKKRLKSTTVFKQLILNIVVPVVVALVILAGLNYFQTKSILVHSNNIKNYIITDGIKQIMELQDLSLSILETRMDTKMEMYSSQINAHYINETDSIDKVDLYKLRKELGMNPEFDDIYIINKNGICVNTTFEKDLGINLFSFGEDHKKMILNVFKGGKFVSERFAIEKSTKRLKKYTYCPTLDGKYIIELGSYSKKADEIIEFIQNTFRKISSKESDILSVDLFIGEENPFTLNKDVILTDEHRKELLKVFHSKDTSTIIDNSEGRTINNEFIYIERKNTNLYKGAIIRVISDRSNDKEILFYELLKSIVIFGLTIIAVILIIYFKTKVITKPIKKLVENVNRIAAGNFDDRADIEGNNEITKLSEHFNLMLERIESYYNELEDKVKERTAEIAQKKEEIEAQRDTLSDKNARLGSAYQEIEKQNKHITDSIRYAKRIQTAILPSDSYVKELLPQSFVLYKPKDIVSGDFYWICEKDDKVIYSAVDCTGHGVPGAFMSIVGNDQLNYAVNIKNVSQPSLILDSLSDGVANLLQQSLHGGGSVKDGMDLALCTIDYKNKKLQFAGAYNPLCFIRDNELIVTKADKAAIGTKDVKGFTCYTNHEIDLKEGDVFYVFSDGYADQFGGPKNKKFMNKRLKELLLEIHAKPMDKQKEILDSKLIEWMGEYEQVDDILIIGVKI